MVGALQNCIRFVISAGTLRAPIYTLAHTGSILPPVCRKASIPSTSGLHHSKTTTTQPSSVHVAHTHVHVHSQTSKSLSFNNQIMQRFQSESQKQNLQQVSASKLTFFIPRWSKAITYNIPTYCRNKSAFRGTHTCKKCLHVSVHTNTLIAGFVFYCKS